MAFATKKKVSLQSLGKSERDLIKSAIEAREMAYAPYSNFKVGCAVLTKRGDVFKGCNVENSSYGMTICAEKTAIVKAVSAGDCEILKLAVVADQEDQPVAPCGSCRQFIHEFCVSNDIVIYCANLAGQKIVETSASELLPFAFRLNPE